MRSLLLALSLLLTTLSLSAQSTTDTIAVKNRMGPVFLKEDKILTPRQMGLMMEPYPEAYSYMQKAKRKAGLLTPLGYVAGALIGWPLGTAIAGGKPEWGMAGVGAGLIVAAIPLSNSYSRNARRAVGIYNQQL